MISDVPLGVMLSGGLDSSLITALMAEQSSRPVQTFSIGFAEDAVSRARATREMVAQAPRHRPSRAPHERADHTGLLDEAIWHLEDPIADVSCLGFMLLSRLAREHVTVALSGQGADELLGGYRKHEIAAAAATAAARRSGACPAARRQRRAAARGDAPRSRAGCCALTTDDPVERLLAMSRVLQPGERERAPAPEFRHPAAEAEIAGVVRQHLPPVRDVAARRDAAPRHARGARRQHAPVLRQDVDGRVARGPRAVHGPRRRLLLLAAPRLAARLAARAARSCSSARAAASSTTTSSTSRRRASSTRALGAWLTHHRDELVRETLLDGRPRCAGTTGPEALQELVAASEGGGKKATQVLFSLVLLERWERLFVDGDASMLPGHATEHGAVALAS